MWRNDDGFADLEPDEIAALAALARQAIPTRPATHPGGLMLSAVAGVAR
jgi:hypothetical protein